MRNHRAGPAAYPGQDRDILLPIRTAISDRLAHNPRIHLEIPKLLAGTRIDGFEPTIHGPVKHDATCGHDRAAPNWKFFLNIPYRFFRARIPGGESAHVAVSRRYWIGIKLRIGTNVRSAGNVVDRRLLKIHRQRLM